MRFGLTENDVMNVYRRALKTCFLIFKETRSLRKNFIARALESMILGVGFSPL